MAITIKDVNGSERNVASKGMAGTALGFGIGGLATALLNGGGGLNLFNNGGTECTVSQTQFYETELSNRDREFSMYNELNTKFCDLAQRVSVNETANAYQNKAIDTQFITDRLITKYEIEAATCGCVKGVPMIRPEQIGDSLHLANNYIRTFSQSPYCGNSTWNNDCGC